MHRSSELAGHNPGQSAAPNGRGLPGCLPWSGEACRSWCRAAAGGLVGRQAPWVRSRPRGFVPDRARAGRAASAGAVWFPVARRLARCPSPHRPITSAPAWWPVASGWCTRRGRSQCRAAPARGVSGINDDHRQARVGRHLDEPVAEARGRDAREVRVAARPQTRPALCA